MPGMKKNTDQGPGDPLSAGACVLSLPGMKRNSRRPK